MDDPKQVDAFALLETDGLCGGGFKVWRKAYAKAKEQLSHKDACQYASDKLREWWDENDKAVPVTSSVFTDWNNAP